MSQEPYLLGVNERLLLYWPLGQLTNRVDSSGTHTWLYDALGRVKTNTTPAGTLYYTYDPAGNLTGLSSATANGVSLTYQYDWLNRLTKGSHLGHISTIDICP